MRHLAENNETTISLEQLVFKLTGSTELTQSGYIIPHKSKYICDC